MSQDKMSQNKISQDKMSQDKNCHTKKMSQDKISQDKNYRRKKNVTGQNVTGQNIAGQNVTKFKIAKLHAQENKKTVIQFHPQKEQSISSRLHELSKHLYDETSHAQDTGLHYHLEDQWCDVINPALQVSDSEALRILDILSQ